MLYIPVNTVMDKDTETERYFAVLVSDENDELMSIQYDVKFIIISQFQCKFMYHLMSNSTVSGNILPSILDASSRYC